MLLLIKSQPLAVEVKQALLRFPVLAFAPHPLAKLRRVETTIARLAYAIENALRFGRQLLFQSLLEIFRDASGQTQHRHKSLPRPTLARSLQEIRNVLAQTRNDWRYAQPHFDPGIR